MPFVNAGFNISIENKNIDIRYLGENTDISIIPAIFKGNKTVRNREDAIKFINEFFDKVENQEKK